MKGRDAGRGRAKMKGREIGRGRDLIDLMRGLSVISVLCAHSHALYRSSGAVAEHASRLLENIGHVGVIVFFAISGYLYHVRKENTAAYLKRKVMRLLPPWIISATAVYLYVYLRKGGLSVSSWLRYLIGDGSYCYYMTVLLLLYLLFAIPFLRRKECIRLAELAGLLFICFGQGITAINVHLNPLSWVFYFALGLDIQKNLEEGAWCSLMRRAAAPASALYALLLVLQVFVIKSGGSYWTAFHLLQNLLGAAALCGAAVCIPASGHFPKPLKRGLLQSGRQSLFIYLWHMPVAGITARLVDGGILSYAVILRPMIVWLLMLGVTAFMIRFFRQPGLRGTGRILGIES